MYVGIKFILKEVCGLSSIMKLLLTIFSFIFNIFFKESNICVCVCVCCSNIETVSMDHMYINQFSVKYRRMVYQKLFCYNRQKCMI